MRSTVYCLLSLVLTGYSLSESCADIEAGAIVVDATPSQLPVHVNGGMTQRLIRKIGSPIKVRAIVVDDSRVRLAIVVVDSCMMSRAFLDEAKSAAGRKTGIRTDRMFISATHTHSAPASMGCLGTDVDPRYPSLLKDRIVEAIDRAKHNLEPARVGAAVFDANEYTALRRWIKRPDRIANDPFGNPTVRATMHAGSNWDDVTGESGPEDPDFSIVSFQSLKGRPIAILGNFSMHYFSGVEGVNADYFGLFNDMMTQELEHSKSDKPAFVSVLGHGCSGDIWRRDYTKRPFLDPKIEDYTAGLVKKATDAYGKIQYDSSVMLAMSEVKLPLKFRTPDKQLLEWAKGIVGKTDGLPKTQEEVYAREQLFLHERPEVELILQAIRIGDIGLTGIPNEVYALTGLKQKAYSPLKTTITFDLANGSEGYIPPPEQHVLGGYNTWACRTAGLEATAEPRIVETCIQLLEKVSKKPRRLPEVTRGVAARAIGETRPIAWWRMDEFEGPRAVDEQNYADGTYESGVVFYLAGPDSKSFTPGQVNRAAHFCGGRMQTRMSGLGKSYSISLWFWNGMPLDSRPVLGWMFSRGQNHSFNGLGDHLGLNDKGQLIFHNGQQIYIGETSVQRWRWHHAVLVRNGDRVQVFLDGQRQIDAQAKAYLATDLFFLGGRNDNQSNWEGRLDEVAIFDRVLQEREIRSLVP
ncbi:MAG: LamG-like jellyroll fold domain-containing protein [Planctomycetota bacterium]|nr:LamG-like jellyroll fold domain-containing protein [Planctomycetota bacterium]